MRTISERAIPNLCLGGLILAAAALVIEVTPVVKKTLSSLGNKLESYLEAQERSMTQEQRETREDVRVLWNNKDIIAGIESRGDAYWTYELYSQAVETYKTALPLFPTNRPGSRDMLRKYQEKIDYFAKEAKRRGN